MPIFSENYWWGVVSINFWAKFDLHRTFDLVVVSNQQNAVGLARLFKKSVRPGFLASLNYSTRFLFKNRISRNSERFPLSDRAFVPSQLRSLKIVFRANFLYFLRGVANINEYRKRVFLGEIWPASTVRLRANVKLVQYNRSSAFIWKSARCGFLASLNYSTRFLVSLGHLSDFQHFFIERWKSVACLIVRYQIDLTPSILANIGIFCRCWYWHMDQCPPPPPQFLQPCQVKKTINLIKTQFTLFWLSSLLSPTQLHRPIRRFRCRKKKT